MLHYITQEIQNLIEDVGMWLRAVEEKQDPLRQMLFHLRWVLFVRILPALQESFLSIRSVHQNKILHSLACVFKVIITAL